MFEYHDPGKDDFKLEEIYHRALESRGRLLKAPEYQGRSLNVLMAHDGLEQQL